MKYKKIYNFRFYS